MDPKHREKFMEEATNILRQQLAAGNDMIESLYCAKNFLKTMKVNASDSEIIDLHKRLEERVS
jgi:hypothetical protein